MPDSYDDQDHNDALADGPPEVSTVHAGIIPLLDCAPVVAAAELETP